MTEVGLPSGMAYDRDGRIQSGMGADFGDYDNDGDADLFLANLSRTNPLYRHDGDGTFIEVTRDSGIILDRKSIGASWADLDNDGDLDLHVTTVESPNLLYINNGNGTFSNEGDPFKHKQRGRRSRQQQRRSHRRL